MTDNFKELAKLVEEHPELPIVPVIRIPDGKRIADCWIKGKLGDSQIETYCEVEGKIYFFTTSRSRMPDVLIALIHAGIIDDAHIPDWDNPSEVERLYRDIPCWETAITVNVN